VRRLLALAFLQRGASAVIYLAATVVLARLLTPAQVGVFSLSAAFIAVMTVLREFGVREYLLQARDLDSPGIRAAFGVSVAVGWSAGAVVLLLGPVIAGYYREPGITSVLTVMSLNFLFLPLATPMAALLYREMDIGRVLAIQTLGVAATQTASVALAWLGYGFMALAWGAVAGSLAQVVALTLSRRGTHWHRPSLRRSGPVWGYCWKYALGMGLESGAKNAHEFVIGRSFGFADLGLYSRAAGLFEQFNQNVSRGIARILLPSFAMDARQGAPGLGQRYRMAAQLYTAVAWPFFGFVASLSQEIIDVLFGSQWSTSAPLLRLMCVAAVLQAAYAFAGDILAGFGQVGARLRIASATAPLWVVLCLLGSTISLQAVALLTAGPAALALVLYSRRLRQLIGFSFSDLARATLSSAALALLVTAVCVGLRAWLARHTDHPAAILVLSAASAAVAWVALAYLLRHPIAGEVSLLARTVHTRLRGRRRGA
jgi:O-antigen/teichoic acid export membrane protein